MSEGIKHLSPDEFPPLTHEMSDPPEQLLVRGTLPSFEKKWLAVVGSRTMTDYGRRACQTLIEGLRGYPVAIVSGLAYGVDAQAHKSALAAGLPTVAVPGSGLDWDVLYPKANVPLAREILKAGGALLSEFDSSTHATNYTFPQRNRIMAGICHATLVIEAKEKSGSLITAKFATGYDRELLVVPGSIFSPESMGTHQFLKLGATPVTTPADVLSALGIAHEEPAPPSREKLSAVENRIMELASAPTSRDELIRALALPAAQANVLLASMELKGLLRDDFGIVQAIA